MIQKLAGFGGPWALALKITVVALVDALLVTMLLSALAKDSTEIVVVVAIVLTVFNLVYFSRKAFPMKFILPGTIFLAIFVVTPMVYTLVMSVYNYRTGNEISKPAAIEGIIANGFAEDPNDEASYYMTLGRTADATWQALVTRDTDMQVLSCTLEQCTVLAAGDYAVGDEGYAVDAEGFAPISEEDLAKYDAKIQSLAFPAVDGSFYTPAVPYALHKIKGMQYDEKTDTFRDVVNGITYEDNGNGNYANVDNPDEKLDPGWRAYSGLYNYLSLLQDPTIRGPFLRVGLWTFAFAFLSVLGMFGFGLLLAIALNKPFRGRNFYRSILILPYAIPSFMSILVWNGLFNANFGAVNTLLGAHIDWYNDPWLARFVVIFVNLWLGIPYFYLISSGALQSIPEELDEAAAIDGANPKQIFRRIRLPLLLQVLSPLLIASFAFNFNNFNIVYLLTAGGPTDVLSGEVAGATDLLITYTYKTAIGSDQQNFGLASAISALVFLIVGALTLWSLRQSKMVDIER